jgi:hypothetical protein
VIDASGYGCQSLHKWLDKQPILASDNGNLQITKSHCPRHEPELWFLPP